MAAELERKKVALGVKTETNNFLWPLTNQHPITSVQLMTTNQLSIPLIWGCVEALVVFMFSSGITNHLKLKYLRIRYLKKGCM